MSHYRCISKKCSWLGTKPERCIYELGPTNDAIGYALGDGICCPRCDSDVEEVTAVEVEMNLCIGD
jgi:hypothetical protein